MILKPYTKLWDSTSKWTQSQCKFQLICPFSKNPWYWYDLFSTPASENRKLQQPKFVIHLWSAWINRLQKDPAGILYLQQKEMLNKRFIDYLPPSWKNNLLQSLWCEEWASSLLEAVWILNGITNTMAWPNTTSKQSFLPFQWIIPMDWQMQKIWGNSIKHRYLRKVITGPLGCPQNSKVTPRYWKLFKKYIKWKCRSFSEKFKAFQGLIYTSFHPVFMGVDFKSLVILLLAAHFHICGSLMYVK